MATSFHPIRERVSDTDFKLFGVDSNAESAALLSLKVVPASAGQGRLYVSIWRRQDGNDYPFATTLVESGSAFQLNVGKLLALFPGEEIWARTTWSSRFDWLYALSMEDWVDVAMTTHQSRDGFFHGTVMVTN